MTPADIDATPPRPLTNAEKQARYRERHRQMHQALLTVLEAKTLREARTAAREALAVD